MVNINGEIEKLLNLPLKIMVALCISSGLILFLPNSMVEKLYMNSFRDNFGFILGIVFVVSLSIILCSIVVTIAKFIINKIRDKRIIKGRNKIMENLDKNEKRLLKLMYDEDDKTLDVPYNSGMITKLSSWGLISPTTAQTYVDLLDPRVPYFLQPWVCEYIQEHKEFFK